MESITIRGFDRFEGNELAPRCQYWLEGGGRLFSAVISCRPSGQWRLALTDVNGGTELPDHDSTYDSQDEAFMAAYMGVLDYLRQPVAVSQPAALPRAMHN